MDPETPQPERPSPSAGPSAALLPPPPEAPGKNVRKAPVPKPPKGEDGAVKEEKEGKSGGTVLVRPAETGWEQGRIKRNAGVFPAQAGSEGPLVEERIQLKNGGALITVLPTRQVLGLPLWLATDDSSLFPDMVQLQLEKRGLMQTAPPPHRLQIRTVQKETGRTLVLALLLAEPCPDELLTTTARGFEPAPLTYPIAENMLAFWKEQDHVVMAYRRGTQLAYLQAFTHSTVNVSFTTELTCVLLPLLQDNVLTDLKRVVAWGTFSAEEVDLLGQTLEFPVQLSPRPGMVLPGEHSPLIPETVVARREAARRASRLKRIGLVMGACYAIFLAFVIGQFLLLKLQVNQLRDNLRANEPTVKRIENSRKTWLAMEPAIDPQFFVAELLLQSALPLPPSGVRMTLFQTEPGSVLIRGEARSFREAQAYFQEISKTEGQNSVLSNYNWVMGDQKTLADGRATFQINGKNALYAGNDK